MGKLPAPDILKDPADRQETNCHLAFPLTSPLLPLSLYRRLQPRLPETRFRPIHFHPRISGPYHMGEHT